jgi:hypothetical protein
MVLAIYQQRRYGRPVSTVTEFEPAWLPTSDLLITAELTCELWLLL